MCGHECADDERLDGRMERLRDRLGSFPTAKRMSGRRPGRQQGRRRRQTRAAAATGAAATSDVRVVRGSTRLLHASSRKDA